MLNIPLQLSRIAIYFPVRKPTKAEWEDDSITKIELTADDTLWDPTSSEFSDQEAVTMNYRGEVIKREATERVNFLSTRLVHASMLQTSKMTNILV